MIRKQFHWIMALIMILAPMAAAQETPVAGPQQKEISKEEVKDFEAYRGEYAQKLKKLKEQKMEFAKQKKQFIDGKCVEETGEACKESTDYLAKHFLVWIDVAETKLTNSLKVIESAVARDKISINEADELKAKIEALRKELAQMTVELNSEMTGEQLAALSQRLKELMRKTNGIKEIFAHLHNMERKEKMDIFVIKLEEVVDKLKAVAADIKEEGGDISEIEEKIRILEGRVTSIRISADEDKINEVKTKFHGIGRDIKSIMGRLQDEGGRKVIQAALAKNGNPNHIQASPSMKAKAYMNDKTKDDGGKK